MGNTHAILRMRAFFFLIFLLQKENIFDYYVGIKGAKSLLENAKKSWYTETSWFQNVLLWFLRNLLILVIRTHCL